MVIIFYDTNAEQIYICVPNEKTRVIAANDPDILDYIPNDDILYVENGHFITKKQFQQWLASDPAVSNPIEEEYSRMMGNRRTGFMDTGPKREQESASSTTQQRRYIHAAYNGFIHITELVTEKYPEGVTLDGKYDFIPVDEIGGEEVLESCRQLKYLIMKGKVEIVTESHVKANAHKKNKKVSPAEAALDKILVPSGVSAEQAASGYNSSNKSSGNDPIEILVD